MKLKNSVDGKMFEVGDETNWYICGPTIHAEPHIGHARTYIVYDSIIKYLRAAGKKVNHRVNITDVDDKIINKVASLPGNIHQNWSDFVIEKLAIFLSTMTQLNIELPENMTCVSAYIHKMIDYMEVLVKKGFAYESNGSVYFDTVAYENVYGKFHVSDTYTSQESNTHVNEKKDPRDFALWKKQSPEDLSYKSPYGYGRPGWHLECSTLLEDLFNSSVDVHGGGIDLKFPHHHNELCQSTAYTGNPNCIKNFVHTGYVTYNKEKMSQSVGNTVTIKDCLQKYTPSQLRLYFLLHDYASEIDYSEESLQYAVYVEKKLYRAYKFSKPTEGENKYDRLIADAFDNNFDTKTAIKYLIEYVTTETEYDYNFLKKWSGILGLTYTRVKPKVETCIDAIADIREKIRNLAGTQPDLEVKKSLFGLADYIRDKKLKDLKVTLEDNNNSQPWLFE